MKKGGACFCAQPRLELGRCMAVLQAGPPPLRHSDMSEHAICEGLGTTSIATNQREYRSFNDARNFVRSLGLKSANDWRAYTKSGKLPADIPAGANRTYAKKGWLDWGDWLGKNGSGKSNTP